MDHYIEQLIEDIKTSASNVPKPEEEEFLSEEEALQADLEAAEDYVFGERHRLSAIVGIPRETLPAPEMLNPGQIEKLLNELEKLLNAWNFYPNFPDKIPDKLKYAALRNVWDSEQYQSFSGMVHIDFCDYDSENCPFPGYCHYCDEMNSDPEAGGYDFPIDDLPQEEECIDEHFNRIEDDYYDAAGLKDEEGFISGIHNYCDRWCERCGFTKQCRVYAMEEEIRSAVEGKNDDSTPNEEDAEDPVGLPDSLTDGDHELPADFNIDPGETDDLESDEKNDFFSSHNKAGRHHMIRHAQKMAWDTHNWLDWIHKGINSHFTGLLAQGHADEVMEALEVLGWYHMFIMIKLKRALSGFYEQEQFEDGGYDMNGSAKVALIGIDNSLKACSTLHLHLKKERQKIKTLQSGFDELKTMAEEQFPDARSFVRPGLDEL